MDPRIGQLNRNGKPLFYAYVNGMAQPPVEGSLNDVMIALGLSPVTRKKGREFKTYIVRIKSKYPAHDEDPDGHDWECRAYNSNDAIALARKHVSDAGHTRQDGPVLYSARIKKEDD